MFVLDLADFHVKQMREEDNLHVKRIEMREGEDNLRVRQIE